MYRQNRDQLSHARYARLRSFRGDGTPVDTPVWFAMDGRQVVFRTKVGPNTRRLAEHCDVELAACDYRGRVRPGTAELAGHAVILAGLCLGEKLRRSRDGGVWSDSVIVRVEVTNV
jgi:PPOX class probable F420-dependent enzyme